MMDTRNTPTLPAPAVTVAEDDTLRDLELPVASAAALLTSGRRYALASGPGGDTLTVGSNEGQIVLRIGITDDGPVLSFRTATLHLEAEEKLTLSAKQITLDATNNLHVAAGKALTLEGSVLEMQANDGDVGVRARNQVLVDADHIGLNDAPSPAPYPWSKAARDE